MPPLSYHIDKTLSEQERCLVLRICPELPGPLSSAALLKRSSGLGLEAARRLNQEELKFQTKRQAKVLESSHDFRICHAPYANSLDLLQLLAGTGGLYFAGKPLVCDFYARTEFYYQVDSRQITGRIRLQGQDFDIRECDLVCPSWYIKGIVLKPLHPSLSSTDLQAILQGSAKLEDIEDNDPSSPKIVFLGNSKELQRQEQQPMPLLLLKDRSGAFADLWMDYGDGRQYPFHETAGCHRLFEVEKGWEKDLLETGFIKKGVGTSHYYCPMDLVAKSLSFLLEIGWTVKDSLGRQVFHQSLAELSAETKADAVHIRGKVCFGDFQADVADVMGAFNRRDRFVQLSSGTVGLLDKPPAGLEAFMEEGEIVAEGIVIPKNRVGVLTSLFEAQPGLNVDDATQALRKELASFAGIAPAPPGPGFLGSLRPYQQIGVNWLAFLYQYGFHGILADDMGLGKTVQVLAFLSRLAMEKPTLIVLPTSLMFNWRKEIESFLPASPLLLHHGSGRTKLLENLQKPQIILTTYATLRMDLLLLERIDFHLIILDEAQAIKNSQSQTSQAVCRLRARFRLSVTGTPLENHLNELWAQFRFLIPDLFGDEQSFEADVLASQADLRYLQKIKRKIRPFILRRRKEEVAQDLPSKIEQTLYVEMGDAQRRLYEDFLSGFRRGLIKKVEADGMGKHRMEVLEALLRLRQICCHPLLVSGEEGGVESAKTEALLQDLDTVAEEGSKALVYSQFTSFLGLLGQRLRNQNRRYVYLDGSTSNREEIVQQFQDNPDIPLFLISLKAGGVGLNLTAADYVFLYDPWWNEAAENQAIDRAHRIGRQDVVIAKRYVMAETVEEKIMKLKAHKRSLVSNLLDDDLAAASFTTQDLLFLFE